MIECVLLLNYLFSVRLGLEQCGRQEGRPTPDGGGQAIVENEAHPHPHERGDEHEVGEIAQIPDIARQIADEDQLQKEGEEAHEKEAYCVLSGGGINRVAHRR